MSVFYSDTEFTSEEERISLTPSSENLNFLANGIYQDDSRATTWRTIGYWRITSANKTLVFTDGGGDLTATLTEGEYSSDADFFAEIKTQMEAVGANVYTIQRDSSTKKIRIGSDTSGFTLRWTSGSNTMADLLGYDDASDDSGAVLDPTFGDYGYNADEIRIHTEEHLIFDFGSPVNPQWISILGPSGKEMPLSNTATIKLQFDATNTFDTPDEEYDLSYDEIGIHSINENGLATTEYRYMKVKFIDVANAFGFLEFSKIAAGSFVSINRGSVQYPLSQDGEDFTTSEVSVSGQIYSQENNTTMLASFTWLNLNAQSKENFDDHYFKDYKSAKSFWIFFDPNQVFTTKISRSTFYARWVRAPQSELQGVNQLYQSRHNIRAQL